MAIFCDCDPNWKKMKYEIRDLQTARINILAEQRRICDRLKKIEANLPTETEIKLKPIVTIRAPTFNDNQFELGQIWIDESENRVYKFVRSKYYADSHPELRQYWDEV